MASRIVQARIDSQTARALARLRRKTGLSDSELVRRGLQLVSEMATQGTARKIRGLGKFASGRRDLGSNKRHLAGFGSS